MTTSGGAGTTLPSANSSTFPDVLGAPASLIGSELSVYLAPAFLMPLAALCGPLPVAAFTFPDCALRGTSGGASMTTPVWRAHPMSRADKRPRARRTGFHHRVGVSCPTWLRPFALPRPDAAGCFLCTSLGGCVHKRGRTRFIRPSHPSLGPTCP
jgi:hypothetical protein